MYNLSSWEEDKDNTNKLDLRKTNESRYPLVVIKFNFYQIHYILDKSDINPKLVLFGVYSMTNFQILDANRIYSDFEKSIQLRYLKL